MIWNHILRYRADIAERVIGQAAVTRAGSYNMVKFRDETYVGYALPGATEAALDNVILYFIQETIAPARLAGEILLVHETLDQTKEHRKAWLYNPGQRRVRRAPNVAFDNPGTGSDGLRTSDQFDIYNGSPERYDWKLVGKQEIIVPYNAYPLHSNKLKYGDILKPLHINQEHARYELHRVWVVDATLKPGQRHIYKRRTFYVDEDSWQILVVDCYDNRDQLWRVQEGHSINYYEIPTFWTTLETTYDLQSGRYLALGLDNEEPDGWSTRRWTRSRSTRQAWLYNPGQRRVRRAPNVALRQSGHRLRRPAHQRPDRHLQRRAGPLRLEAGRQEGNVRPVQRLPAAQQQAEVQGHPEAAAHQPGARALRAAPRVGRGRDAEARPAPHLQAPHVLHRRGLAGRSWSSTATTTATSSGACRKAIRSTTTTSRPSGRRSRRPTTCSPAATSRSASTTKSG